MRVLEIRMLKWICGHRRLGRISNGCIRKKEGIAPIDEKIWEMHMR